MKYTSQKIAANLDLLERATTNEIELAASGEIPALAEAMEMYGFYQESYQDFLKWGRLTNALIPFLTLQNRLDCCELGEKYCFYTEEQDNLRTEYLQSLWGALGNLDRGEEPMVIAAMARLKREVPCGKMRFGNADFGVELSIEKGTDGWTFRVEGEENLQIASVLLDKKCLPLQNLRAELPDGLFPAQLPEIMLLTSSGEHIPLLCLE